MCLKVNLTSCTWPDFKTLKLFPSTECLELIRVFFKHQVTCLMHWQRTETDAVIMKRPVDSLSRMNSSVPWTGWYYQRKSGEKLLFKLGVMTVWCAGVWWANKLTLNEGKKRILLLLPPCYDLENNYYIILLCHAFVIWYIKWYGPFQLSQASFVKHKQNCIK